MKGDRRAIILGRIVQFIMIEAICGDDEPALLAGQSDDDALRITMTRLTELDSVIIFVFGCC